MKREWRDLVAVLHAVVRRARSARERLRVAPLAGIVVGVAGALAYWMAAQLWPTSIAVALAMLATVSIASFDARAGDGVSIPGVLFLLIEYNALMALSTAALPFALPENMTLGWIMIAAHAASRALALSVATLPLPSVQPQRMTGVDLTIALLLGALPAALLGLPGLIGLAAALCVCLGASAMITQKRATQPAGSLEFIRQLAHNCFYLGALATWKYV